MTITGANLAQMHALISRLQKDGVRVAYQAGWDHRDAGGLFGPFVGGVIHHDASSARSGTWGAIGIIVAGRGGANPVPGPLAQFQIARGTIPQIAVVTAGRGNHAGIGGPYLNVPKDSGNRWLVGTEVANDGVSEPYSEATLWTIESWGRAVYDLTGQVLVRVIGHNEWAASPSAHLDTPTSKATGRKSDPRYNMTWMRARIRAHQPKTTEQEFTMDAAAKQAFGDLGAQISAVHKLETVGDGPDVPIGKDTHGYNFKGVYARIALLEAEVKKLGEAATESTRKLDLILSALAPKGPTS